MTGFVRTGSDIAAPGRMIRRRRAELGLTLESLARSAGVGKGFLSMIENGRRLPRDRAVWFRIEQVLGIPAGELVWAACWVRTPAEIRERFLELDRLAAARGVGAAMRVEGAEEVRIPIFNSVRELEAPWPHDAGSRGATGGIVLPGVEDRRAFAVRVEGESMLPCYAPGDLVVFSPVSGVESGRDCLAWIRGRAGAVFVRLYVEPGLGGREMVRLQPLNTAYGGAVLGRRQVERAAAAIYQVRGFPAR